MRWGSSTGVSCAVSSDMSTQDISVDGWRWDVESRKRAHTWGAWRRGQVGLGMRLWGLLLLLAVEVCAQRGTLEPRELGAGAMDVGGTAASAPADDDDGHQGEAYGGKPTYIVIPIEGTIGVDVTAKVFKRAIWRAQKANPTVIVLRINSPGGWVAELSEMLKVLNSCEHPRVVAYVERAASAAAVLALSCKEIVISETGYVGGAVVYRITPDGTPDVIEEKMESVLRAQFRSAVQDAGHNELLLEGMMKADLRLSLRQTADGPRVVEGDGERVLKAYGEILTLDAQQAVATGLAVGNAASLDDAHTVLGLPTWRQHSLILDGLFERWRKELARARAEYENVQHDVRMILFEAVGHAQMAVGRDARHRERQVEDCLEKAERRLARAVGLLKKYPQLGEAEEVKERRRQMQEIRKLLTARRR